MGGGIASLTLHCMKLAAVPWGQSWPCSDKCSRKVKVTFQFGGLTLNQVPGRGWISASHQGGRTILQKVENGAKAGYSTHDKTSMCKKCNNSAAVPAEN